MPYRVWATNDVPSAADFNALFADPVTNDVAALETSTSTTYTDLTTAGPSVSITMVNGQKASVVIRARQFHSVGGGGNAVRFSFATTGATVTAANDANSCESLDVSGMHQECTTIFTATATGSHTFTMKYRRAAASGTGSWLDRRITVKTW